MPNRERVIRNMVRNYHAQVQIVGSTNISLVEYLKNIGLNPIELETALEYNKRFDNFKR